MISKRVDVFLCAFMYALTATLVLWVNSMQKVVTSGSLAMFIAAAIYILAVVHGNLNQDSKEPWYGAVVLLLVVLTFFWFLSWAMNLTNVTSVLGLTIIPLNLTAFALRIFKKDYWDAGIWLCSAVIWAI